MVIPKEITILKHKIKVIYVRTLEDKFGEFDPVKLEIKIAQYALSIARLKSKYEIKWLKVFPMSSELTQYGIDNGVKPSVL